MTGATTGTAITITYQVTRADGTVEPAVTITDQPTSPNVLARLKTLLKENKPNA